MPEERKMLSKTSLWFPTRAEYENFRDSSSEAEEFRGGILLPMKRGLFLYHESDLEKIFTKDEFDTICCYGHKFYGNDGSKEYRVLSCFVGSAAVSDIEITNIVSFEDPVHGKIEKTLGRLAKKLSLWDLKFKYVDGLWRIKRPELEPIVDSADPSGPPATPPPAPQTPPEPEN